MRPRRPKGDEPDDLFRARLSQQLDLKHPLVRLAGLIDWEGLESAFGPLYHERAGRPGKPTRLMVGLTYLKHTYNLSDEAVCERWVAPRQADLRSKKGHGTVPGSSQARPLYCVER